jgi:hypothetical protein
LRQAAEAGDSEAFQRLVEGADPRFGGEIEAVAEEYFEDGAAWIRPFLPKPKALVVPEWLARANVHRTRGWAEVSGISFEEALRLREEAARVVAAKAVPEIQPGDESKAEPKAEAGAKVKFDKRDHASVPKEPMTLDERDARYEVLLHLYGTDPTEYELKKKELAQELGITQKTVEKEVKLLRDERKEVKDDEVSQAAKIIAIGMSKDVRLWHSAVGNAYASVRVSDASVRSGEHWENYRVGSGAFDHVLRAEYGKANQAKIGDRWVWQAPGTQALKDGKATLESYAKFQGKEREPAIRIGGDREVIWIDLGDSSWRVVRVSAEGWEVVSRSDVAFIRTGTMLALPEPVRGGDIRVLRRLMNVRKEEFVLVPGWMLQVLNPVGPYALLNMWGDAEMGKTTLTRQVLRCVDPSSANLRKIRKEEDIIVAAKNNWTIGLDNFSHMSAAMSDLFCTLATGISFGGRRLYTDDDENVVTVQRPGAFNGIPGDLVERADLASRLIKIHVPSLVERRTEAELEAEFVRVWPRVFGALLDGLVAALRDSGSVVVRDPARLMDFEKFAEAGCRGMGFARWEFVEAYAANRRGSLVSVAEAQPVARAVVQFLKMYPKGFRGQMSKLYQVLEPARAVLDISLRDWPKNPAKLSSELSRVRKPLAAVGIRVLTQVDRRSEGGSQYDCIVEREE